MSREKLWPEGHVEERSKALYEELYIDSLEGELDAEFEKDLAIWLKSSAADDGAGSARSVNADELEKLSQIRQGLKNSNDIVIPENPEYFDALESRIMASLDAAIEAGDVKERKVEAAPEIKSRRGKPRQSDPNKATLKLPTTKSDAQVSQGLVAHAAKIQRRSLSIRAGQLAILAGLALLTTGKWLVGPSLAKTERRPEASVANQLRATHRAAPSVLTGTVISFESEGDLALEIAARRMVAYHKGE